MATNEQQPQDLNGDALAMLLHGNECPVGYKCLAMGCIECLQIYMDQGGVANARK